MGKETANNEETYKLFRKENNLFYIHLSLIMFHGFLLHY